METIAHDTDELATVSVSDTTATYKRCRDSRHGECQRQGGPQLRAPTHTAPAHLIVIVVVLVVEVGPTTVTPFQGSALPDETSGAEDARQPGDDVHRDGRLDAEGVVEGVKVEPPPNPKLRGMKRAG